MPMSTHGKYSKGTKFDICNIYDKCKYRTKNKYSRLSVRVGKHVIDTNENREHNCNFIIHHLQNTEYNFA